MNSTKASCRKKYSAAPYFGYSMKSSRYLLAVYLVAVILAMLLPGVIQVGKHGQRGVVSYDFDSLLLEIGGIGFLLSALMGLFSGMTSLSYVNNKQNITCFHSFPLKRTSVFLCEVPAGGIYYLVSIVVGFISAYAITAIPSGHDGKAALTYVGIFITSLFVYLLVNSATVLSAGLTGTGAARFLMTCAVLLLPLILYTLVVMAVDSGFSDLYAGYYINGVMEFICPAYRLLECAYNHVSSLSDVFLTCLHTLPYIVIYYAGALLLHIHRKTERTGSTVIWKPVFTATKYVTIFTSALLGIYVFGGSLIFGTSSNNTLDVLFGAVIGLFCSYIVVNCILYRSVRMMFRDFKKFLVMAAATILFALAVPANVFGFMGGMYSEANTKSLTVTNEDVEIHLGADAIEEINALYDSGMNEYYVSKSQSIINSPTLWSKNDEDYISEHFGSYVDDTYFEEGYSVGQDVEVTELIRYTVPSSFINVVQKPKFGLPLAVDIYVPRNNSLWEKIVTSDEYVSRMRVSEWLDAESVHSVEASLGRAESGTVSVNRYVIERIEKMIKLCKYDEEAIKNSPIVGYIQFFFYTDEDGSRDSVCYPITTGEFDLINAADELICYVDGVRYEPFASAEEYYKDALENAAASIMVNTETGEARRVGIDEIISFADGLLTCSMGQDNKWLSSNFVSPADVGYVFVVADEYSSTRVLYFREGDKNKLDTLFDSLS